MTIGPVPAAPRVAPLRAAPLASVASAAAPSFADTLLRALTAAARQPEPTTAEARGTLDLLIQVRERLAEAYRAIMTIET